MIDDETQNPPEQDTDDAPSEPKHDPMVHPAPPSNPETNQTDVERGREQIEKITGH